MDDILHFLITILWIIQRWTQGTAYNGHPRYTSDQSAYGSYQVSKYVNLHCYSCMSPIFAVTIKGLDDVDELDVWENTKKFYNRPAKFTKSCNAETYNVHDLTLRNCTDACVWLSMENVIAGKSYRGYIRGCLSDLVDYNRTTMRFITYRAQCVPVTLKTLFAQSSGRTLQYADQRVNFCACHSNRCNGSSGKASSSFWISGRRSFTKINSVLICILFLLLNRTIFRISD